MEETKNDNRDELRMDLQKLSEQDLEELARVVVRKLRESIRQESDRSGRF